MAEYILLLGVSLTVFLALFAAFSMAAATAENDATAIVAKNIASAVSAAICGAAGDGTASAHITLELPPDICGKPYVIYPSADGRHLIVMVSRTGQPQKYETPLELRADGVRIEGFAASDQGELRISYDTGARMVTLS
ncbi:hypothetical protein RCIX643 [Methanocella arvoryzae MRE50]|uniref:Uncharacterized protein n=2 Tax=Methanocella TaxID=570266 RepID=Q0W6E9_METAR|nr:hypothetical protein RCIX643 [Methanocella arvoryzae MRE50]